MRNLVIVSLAILLLIGSASAIELKQSQPQESVSYMIAFVAGVLSILSPCSVPLLLGYLAIMSKKGKAFWPKTLSFFAGLSLTWVLLGVSASGLGSAVSDSRLLFLQITGLVIMVLGLMHLLGISLPTLRIGKRVETSVLGMFVFGALFTLAVIPCVGPILAGILVVASTLDAASGALLLFIYAVGFMLAVLAIFFLLKKGSPKAIFEKRIILGKREIPLTNLVIGAFLIIIGAFYLFDKAGLLADAMAPLADFGLGLERSLLANPGAVGVLALLILLIVVALAWRKQSSV